ncbi:MAG TPA: GNAT family N-acetyltransferase [Bryobacteraceae bacterium]|nr:GNAT family N-acetyltransferase [Bryobacteraceae bacterium]
MCIPEPGRAASHITPTGSIGSERPRRIRAGCTGELAGCVGLRRFDDLTCEMKRLYVRPAHRGTGLGRRLALAIMAQGRALGYQRMRLDTLPRMAEAQRLYRSLGFNPIPPYGAHDVPGTQFLEAELDPR